MDGTFNARVILAASTRCIVKDDIVTTGCGALFRPYIVERRKASGARWVEVRNVRLQKLLKFVEDRVRCHALNPVILGETRGARLGERTEPDVHAVLQVSEGKLPDGHKRVIVVRQKAAAR